MKQKKVQLTHDSSIRQCYYRFPFYLCSILDTVRVYTSNVGYFQCSTLLRNYKSKIASILINSIRHSACKDVHQSELFSFKRVLEALNSNCVLEKLFVTLMH